MSAIRSTNNRTEAALRRTLHGMGLRYRKYCAGLPGKPDFVFPTERVAVFVDGDYWHGRLLRERGRDALVDHYKTNEQRSYWVAKLERNAARDDYVTNVLASEGWVVLRFWESDTKRELERVANEIARTVRDRRPAAGTGRRPVAQE
jgi:DNA mismatch endonuclease (patch repair protein)